MTSLRESILQIPAVYLAIIFFLIIFAFNWIGYRTRLRIKRLYPDKEVALGTAEGSLLGLMALLLAFSFNMAATKYESRRQMIIEEANQLSVAILRCELFPDSAKQGLQSDFKQYLETRINYYYAGDNPEKIKIALEEGNKHFKSIWKKAAALTGDPAYRPRADQLAAAVANLKNLATSREAIRQAPVPSLILIVLLVLVFVSSFVIGYGTKPGNRNTFLSIAFALMTTVVIYLIMELGRPSQGYINLQNAQQKVEDLRNLFS